MITVKQKTALLICLSYFVIVTSGLAIRSMCGLRFYGLPPGFSETKHVATLSAEQVMEFGNKLIGDLWLATKLVALGTIILTGVILWIFLSQSNPNKTNSTDACASRR